MNEQIAPSTAIITALPHEWAAVETVFGFANKMPISKTSSGIIGNYVNFLVPSGGSISLVGLMLPDMGNNMAATLTATVLAAHPSIHRIIMVGIAGAVPFPEKTERHVRVGDIVVSNRNGVVQYDLVKQGEGFLERRFPPRPPSMSLLSAVKYVNSLEARGIRPWEKIINEAQRTLDKNWKRPSPVKDKFSSGQGSKDLLRRKGHPRIFHAPIASANVLLKDPKLRDQLRDQYGVGAVEMEASGIADASWVSEAAGYLIIRGTCDYCDADKNDDWQKYAALIAAAYARSVVEQLPGDEKFPDQKVGAPATIASVGTDASDWLHASIPLRDGMSPFVEGVLSHIEKTLKVRIHRTYTSKAILSEVPQMAISPRGVGAGKAVVYQGVISEGGARLALPPHVAIECFGTTFETVRLIITGKQSASKENAKFELAIDPMPKLSPLNVRIDFSKEISRSLLFSPNGKSSQLMSLPISISDVARLNSVQISFEASAM